MITYLQAIILGLLQGVSELFPVSSLGHSVILPALLNWHINQDSAYFLLFLVATHLATALVLFIFFFKEWKKIFQGMWKSVIQRKITWENYDGRLGWLLVVGTVPAGIIGLLFQKDIQLALSVPTFACLMLIANGGLLYFGEFLRKKALLNNRIPADQRIAHISWWQAVKIGFAQIIALIPGFSRSGSTLTGGLAVGLSHEDAARFSFLLATPIIGAAALLKLPALLHSGAHEIQIAFTGALCAAIAAYISVKFLMKYFKTNTLAPFALYCVSAGIIFYAILLFKP